MGDGVGVGVGGRLAGRSALVTGAARGIGRATAELFAAEGARLVLADVDGDAVTALGGALTAGGAEARTVTGDVSVPADARAMVDAVVDAYGRIDVLVANAGVLPLHTVAEATPEDWDAVMAVDGRGMFLTCKYAIERMAAAGGGSIVCLSSISGVAGQAGQAVYGPAKFVATGLTKHLAVECAPQNIRVNAVAPGTIRTDRVIRLADEPGGPEYLGAIVGRHPMGRLGEPAEVARAVLFLASDEASFVTGAVLPVDGGYLAQ
ncbi:SDR family NAD(P)-dependent oxidoreductase [Kitasatospora sp. NE20-6]|uniref:SDR family NAD(P)-dependent oxidoreductase n=1 Tax=Kitasatospora sp. NE20-6 TaxID=2859066 RepID=UPI0038B3566A